MESGNPLSVVQAWQDAANRQDIDRLLELSADDIEIVGPRGSGYGHQLLRDWMGRAGLTLTTLRAFVRGGDVVLEQHGVWRSVQTGEERGSQTLASCFRVEDGRVARFARHDDLDAALRDAGLDYSDEL